MKNTRGFVFGVLLACAAAALAASGFNYFVPATGVLIGSATSPVTTAATFPDSVAFASPAITLTNDAATPGNSMLYGTNGSGTKGWYNQPSSGAGLVTGTFTATLTGVTTTPTTTVNYACITGYMCVLNFAGTLTGTSNGTGMTITGLPSAAQPATSAFVFAVSPNCEDAGGPNLICAADFAAGSGTITFYKGTISGTTINTSPINFGNVNAWTNSGTKGFNGLTLMYSVQ